MHSQTLNIKIQTSSWFLHLCEGFLHLFGTDRHKSWTLPGTRPPSDTRAPTCRLHKADRGRRSLALPPRRSRLPGRGEGPLGGGDGRLPHSLIGHDPGGELRLRLLEAGIGLPVQAVDLQRGKNTRRHRHWIHAAAPPASQRPNGGKRYTRWFFLRAPCRLLNVWLKPAWTSWSMDRSLSTKVWIN